MTEENTLYGYKTIPGLAREIGVSDATVRRYINNYPQFFQSKKVDGWDQYPIDQSVKVLKRINEISSAGQRRSEVLKILNDEFDEIKEPITGIHAYGELLSMGGGEQIEFGPVTLSTLEGLSDVEIEFGPKTLALLDRIAVALEKQTA